MADQKEIEALYDWLDFFHELRLGKNPDISAAFFDGDFSKTLEQAQKDKHEWILEGVGIDGPGKKVMDIGCGLGPALKAIQRKGVTGFGITLSSAQAKYCKESGLDVEVSDWKDADVKKHGPFDAIICVGAFEHFCSEEEYNDGVQEEIYEKFFDFCADNLKSGGKIYLQTMIWGKKIPISSEMKLDAPEGSPERILARLRKFYPGSWLPSSIEQIVKIADKRFRFITSNNGRKDYIETLNRWGQATKIIYRFPKVLRAIPAVLKLVPRYFLNADFRIQLDSVMHNDQQVCFKEEIMTHERMFFEKR